MKLLQIIIALFLPCILLLNTVVSQNNLSFVTSKDVFGTRVFIENKGQFDSKINTGDEVLYAYENGPELIYFTNKGLVYKQVKRHSLTKKEFEAMEHQKETHQKPDEVYFVKMNWVNAKENIEIIGSEKQSHYFTYGTSSLNSNTFKKITYKNVYTNIDIEYVIPRDKENGIKYNIILHPGANPNDIEISYSGDIKKISLSKSGDVVIRTYVSDIIEHAPLCFSQHNNRIIKSNFDLNESIISFSVQSQFPNSDIVIIDPWVTTVTSLGGTNAAYDVDFDYAGNLYIYGGRPLQVSKYTATGTLVWTFAGVVTTPSWYSGMSGNLYNYPGNFIVNKSTGKCYIGQGINTQGGTVIIRLDINGVYDNFMTTANPIYEEIWDFAFNGCTNDVIGLGGSTSSNLTGGVIDQVTANFNPISFTPSYLTDQHDVVSSTMDDNGNLFVIYASGGVGATPALNNKIARVNIALNGTIWLTPSNYMSFFEAGTKSSFVNSAYVSNGFNCLSVNTNYLYYYDGFNLAAYNKVTGIRIGFTTIAGHLILEQAGIAADDCDNVYIGGNGDVKIYHFDGLNFNYLSSIPLATSSVDKYVFDMKLNRTNNSLYVSGSAFTGIYSAIVSSTCNPVNQSVQLDVVPNCVGSTANAVATVTTNLMNPTFSYTWTGAAGIISQTTNTSSPTNSVTGLASGTYSVYVHINAPCGPIYTNTFTVNCSPCSALANGSVSCNNGSYSLNVVSTLGFTATPTYTWSGPSPSNYFSNLANPTFTNGSNGVYTLTASDGGCVSISTVNLVSPSFTTTATNSSITCYNASTGSASVTVNGGTGPFSYTWTSIPIQNSSVAINLPAGSYSCVIMDNSSGCVNTVTTQINQPSALTLTLSASTLSTCVTNSITLTGLVNGGTGPYTYAWTPLLTPTPTNVVTNTIAGNYSYTLTVSDANNCPISNTISLNFAPNLLVSATSASICTGGTATLTATGATTYTWSTGATTNSIVVNPTTTSTYTVLTSSGICSSTAVQTITVSPSTTPTIIVSSTTVSCGSTATLTATGATTYTWNTGATTSTIAVNPISTSTYTVLTGNGTCTNIAVQTITVNSLPTPTITASSAAVSCGSSATLTAIGAVTYTWNTGATTSSIIVTPTSTFIYTVSTGSGACTSNSTISVTYVSSTVTLSVSPDVTITTGSQTQLTVTGNGSNYIWSPSQGLSCTTCTNPIASPVITTTYCALTSTGTCSNQACVVVTVKESCDSNKEYGVPNAFSPNGDGNNDVFCLQGWSGCVTGFLIKIYDRWGEKIYESSDENFCWDGTYKGKLLDPAVFVYYIQATIENTGPIAKKGNITLIK